jgi:hypothetical protein
MGGLVETGASSPPHAAINEPAISTAAINRVVFMSLPQSHLDGVP